MHAWLEKSLTFISGEKLAQSWSQVVVSISLHENKVTDLLPPLLVSHVTTRNTYFTVYTRTRHLGSEPKLVFLCSLRNLAARL